MEGQTTNFARQKEREGKVPVLTKLIQGTSALPGQHKEWAFNTLLLLYYSQVLELSAIVVGLVLGVAIVVDAVSDPIVGSLSDNFKSRLLINDYCIKYKKILISSAISKYDGHIFSFNFKKDGPCLRCFMPNIPSLEQNCETDGIMSTLAGIAGSIQANEVIKSILNIGKPLRNEIMIFNSLDLSFRKVKLNKNSNCKNHLHVLRK